MWKIDLAVRTFCMSFIIGTAGVPRWVLAFNRPSPDLAASSLALLRKRGWLMSHTGVAIHHFEWDER